MQLLIEVALAIEGQRTIKEKGFALIRARLFELNIIPDICHFFYTGKILPKKRVNYDKIHSKLPIFCVKSLKIYTGQKKFTRAPPVTNMRYVPIWSGNTVIFQILKYCRWCLKKKLVSSGKSAFAIIVAKSRKSRSNF